MKRLLKLIGKKVNNIFLQLRDMMILNFGNEIEYSLHISSFVRILRGNEIIFTSADVFFNPNYEQKSDSDDYLIDITIENARKLLIGANVVDLDFSELGDVKIKLSNGVVIDIITDCLFNDYEYFRFIEYSPFYSESQKFVAKHFIFSYKYGQFKFFQEE